MNDGSISSDLYHLFAAYFHQDWDLFADDWQGVLDVYVRGEDPGPGLMRKMAREVDDVRREQTGPALEKLISHTVGVDYSPAPLTYEEWLGQVAERLRQHATAIENGIKQ